MGGLGSGNWYRFDKKHLVEECWSLDVNRWHREGLLRPGLYFSWAWELKGEKKASIGVRTFPAAVELSYTIRPGKEDAEVVRYIVPITWTDCNYGGRRPWFVCPGKGCGRRVGKLYLYGKYFLCRYCHGLAYESQRADVLTSLIRKAQKIRRRLGGSSNLTLPFPKKPKWMHWKTYDEFLSEAYNLELSISKALAAKFEKWTAIIEERKGKLANRYKGV